MKDYDKTLLLALQASASSYDIYLKKNEENIQNFVSMLDKLDSFIKAPCTLDAIREEMRGRRYQIELHVRSMRDRLADDCLVADATGVVKATIVGLPDEFDETTYAVRYDSNHTKSNDVIVIEERIEDCQLFRDTETKRALDMAQKLNAVELNISECAERAAQNNRFFYQGRQRALQKQQETLNKSEK